MFHLAGIIDERIHSFHEHPDANSCRGDLATKTYRRRTGATLHSNMNDRFATPGFAVVSLAGESVRNARSPLEYPKEKVKSSKPPIRKGRIGPATEKRPILAFGATEPRLS